MRPRGRKDYTKIFWKAIREIARERKARPSSVFTELVKKQIEKALEGDYRFMALITDKVFYVNTDDKKYDAVKIIFEDVTGITGGEQT